MINISKHKECEGCGGTGLQQHDTGLLRPCNECAKDYKAWTNQYGTDPLDGRPTILFVEGDMKEDEKYYHEQLEALDRKPKFIHLKP